MVETLIGGSRAAATMSLDHLVRTFERYEEGFNAGLFRIPLQQAARLSHTARIDTFPASVDRYTLAVRRDVKLQLGLGLVRGETLHQMSKRIAPRIAASVDNIGSGLANKYTYWSDRIVRTEVLTAYNEHELEHLKALYKNEPDLLMEWNAANDLRTCVECRSLDGEKAAPGQLFKNMYSNPPAHPMCRCSLLPYMKHWFN
jgi:SPP1 gp7 family putative phage head morphogenesis protein